MSIVTWQQIQEKNMYTLKIIKKKLQFQNPFIFHCTELISFESMPTICFNTFTNSILVKKNRVGVHNLKEILIPSPPIGHYFDFSQVFFTKSNLAQNTVKDTSSSKNLNLSLPNLDLSRCK